MLRRVAIMGMLIGSGFFSSGVIAGGGGNPSTTAFDPTQVAATVALSNGNRTATISGNNIQGRAYTLAGKSSGKFYAEFWIVSQSAVGSPRFGIAPAGASLTTGVGFGADEWAIVTNSGGAPRILNNNGNAAFGVAIGAGDVIGIAVDFGSNHIWFARNNVWMESGDPATDTNPAATITDALTYYPCVSYATSGDQIAVIDSPASQTYEAPAGFDAWS